MGKTKACPQCGTIYTVRCPQCRRENRRLQRLNPGHPRNLKRLGRLLFNVSAMLEEELRGQDNPAQRRKLRAVKSARRALADCFPDGNPFPRWSKKFDVFLPEPPWETE